MPLKERGKKVLKIKKWPNVRVHTCNPSYSGGRDQEDDVSKLAPGKYFLSPYLKKKNYKRKGLMECSSSKSACLASMRH
jgi:hypothetical protein